MSSTSPATRAVGFWSAVLATVFSLAYSLAQVAEWLGWLGLGRAAPRARPDRRHGAVPVHALRLVPLRG